MSNAFCTLRNVTPRFFLFLCLLLHGSGAQLFAQKNKNDRRDEQRENERVKRAEKEVAEAKKKLGEEQKELNAAVKKLDAIKEKLIQAKRKLREAENQAEKEIGESIGIPAVMDQADRLTEKCEQIEKPILEILYKDSDYQRAEKNAVAAKQKRSELDEDLEMEDDEREKKRKELAPILALPRELEQKALAGNSTASAARADLNNVLAKLAELRAKISRDQVNAHPKVKQPKANVVEVEKELNASEKSVASARSSAIKAQRSLNSAQSELVKAREADAKDPNRPKKK